MLKEHLGGVKKKNPDSIYTISARTIELRFKALATKKLGEFEGYNPMRPHSLRSAFRTLLGDADMNETYIEFFMGHTIPEHKRLPEQVQGGLEEDLQGIRAHLNAS